MSFQLFLLGLNALCHGAAVILSLPLCPSCVLALQCNCSTRHSFCGSYLWDSSVWERTCAWLPIYLSLISIMHTLAIPPTASQSFSLFLLSHSKISLILLCLASLSPSKQRTISQSVTRRAFFYLSSSKF